MLLALAIGLLQTESGVEEEKNSEGTLDKTWSRLSTFLNETLRLSVSLTVLIMAIFSLNRCKIIFDGIVPQRNKQISGNINAINTKGILAT